VVTLRLVCTCLPHPVGTRLHRPPVKNTGLGIASVQWGTDRKVSAAPQQNPERWEAASKLANWQWSKQFMRLLQCLAAAAAWLMRQGR